MWEEGLGDDPDMHAKNRREHWKLPNHGKVIVAGVRDRKTKRVVVRVVTKADRGTFRVFLREQVEAGDTLYTGEAAAHKGLADFRHECVNHSAGKCARRQIHTYGMESFWSLFKRAYHGTFHRISAKHSQRYANEGAGRQGLRSLVTIDQMKAVACGMVGLRPRLVRRYGSTKVVGFQADDALR